MRTKLLKGETLKKDWVGGKAGVFGNASPLHLAVTDKRLIFYREKGNAVSASSIENRDLEGFQGGYDREPRKGLAMFGLVLIFCATMVAVLLMTGKGDLSDEKLLENGIPALVMYGAGLLFVLLGLLLKKTVLRLTIYTTVRKTPTVSIGASALKEGTDAAFKAAVSCRTSAKEAQDILETLGAHLN